MIRCLYSIYDRKTEQFSDVISEVNDESAIRMFTMLVNDPKTTFYNWSEDYSLFYLGSLDNLSGIIHSDNYEVCSAMSVRKVDTDEEK